MSAKKDHTTLELDETLGDLISADSVATGVLLRHRLDVCWGGGQPLHEACRVAGIDPAAVIAEIKAERTRTGEEPKWWDVRPLPDLIDHIETHYHEPLRKDLPALVEAARKVEQLHAGRLACPRGLAEHLERVCTNLLEHMAQEEEVLFPALRSGSRGESIQMPIRAMMEEHHDHGVDLTRTRALTADFEIPTEACGTWRALYLALYRFEFEMMEHIHLENDVLFPRVLAGGRSPR